MAEYFGENNAFTDKDVTVYINELDGEGLATPVDEQETKHGVRRSLWQ